MSALNIFDADFETEVLESKTPVLVDFWAEWCGPCKAMAPALDELSAEMGGKAKIAKVNIDEAMDTALACNVRGVPTLMIFKDGEAVATRNGQMTKTALADWIAEYL